jgi:RNA polymerase sigma-70 factor (ECF subfamily)
VVLVVTRRWGIGPMSLPRGPQPPSDVPDEPVADVLLPSAEDAAAALPADPIAARAFVEGLFARHHGEIYAYLIRMLRDPELAADLAQDAFIRAYRAHASLEDPTKARAWLYQIANRVALDEIRRRKIVRFIPWTGESRGAAPSAERLAMDTRFSGELERALARIPERQRSALLLAEVHDLTGVELAASLGTSHVAARALLTRARESLRRVFAEERLLAAEAEAAGRPLDRPATRGTRPNGRG